MELVLFMVDELSTMSEPIFITKDTHFMMCLEDFPEFPSDKNDIPIHLGDQIKLLHNGHVGRVRLMEYVGNGNWILGITSGHGCFMLPESKFNVVHV